MTENVMVKKSKKTEVSLWKSSKKMILALQHLIAMFGATVLVPILTGLNPSVALFTAGLGTLIFHLCTEGKVPVFLGSSFAFIPLILTVKELYNGDLAYVQGGMIVAGLIYVILAFFIKKIGVKRITKYLSPQVVGPMIIVIGMNLVPTAFGMARENLVIAAITLGTALLINFKGRGFVKQLSILIGVITGYMVSLGLGIVDTNIVKEAALFGIPSFSLPKFDIGAIMIISPVVLAVFMEHLGDITTNGQVVGKNFIEDPGLNRTLLGDGIATVVAALIGGPANTTYGENTGVLAITKNYDPSILRLAAVFAIILSFVSKIGAVLNSIPTSVMGGISLMLFSMISLIGVQTIRTNKVEFNWKNVLTMGSILILGLGSGMIESKFGIVIGIPVTETVKISGLSFAAIVGILMNAILNRGKI
ncbi:uracil-xanthine permease family protein [Tepidimicrobium xylanilyticum]|uniref:Uracil permease n=1 Tax=Tepidimicrobium xylanilyticum TaxID=1123352 RepID=A0A1H3D938_9FIRM|nr:uracil-xanthine permease family protein [Tepidimicrobium xylanilyticum]GMG97937.1 ABC transporter permease [Tepidimicrobium xylanilyticum]SDX62810.1 uracil permease [Tepidimicrobium xylanilyticum]